LILREFLRRFKSKIFKVFKKLLFYWRRRAKERMLESLLNCDPLLRRRFDAFSD